MCQDDIRGVMQQIWSQESCAAGSYAALGIQRRVYIFTHKTCRSDTRWGAQRVCCTLCLCVLRRWHRELCISEVTQHFSMRRMCFSLCSALPDFSCLGWIFSTLAAFLRLSGFWESFSKMFQLLLTTRLGGKKPHILTLLQTICMERAVLVFSDGSTNWEKNMAFVPRILHLLPPLCDFPQISHISFPETSVCAASEESF